MGTWDDAERFRQQQDEAQCPNPTCGETRLIDKTEHEWYCYVCSTRWPVVTYNDAQLLKGLKISPS